MRKLLCCAASAAALIFAASAADTAAPKTPAKTTAKPAVKTAPPKTAAVKPAAAKTGATHTAASKTGSSRSSAARRTSTASRRPGITWRNRQAAPTTDRYREIQDALVAKGYLQPEDANGKWDQSSVEALKRFQTEQNLDSTGKLNSLSLIALGLGPKYDSAASAKPAESPNGQR